MARTSGSRRKERTEDRRTRLLEGLLELDHVVFSLPDLQDRLEGILSKVLELLGLQAGTIHLLEGDGQLLLKAHRGLSPFFLSQTQHHRLGTDRPDISGARAPMLVPDVGKHPNFSQTFYQQEGIKSVVMTPLRAEDRLVGTFVLMAFREERALDEEDLHFLEEAGNRLGRAVLSSQEHEETRRRKKSLELLLAVSRAVGQSLAQEEILERAMTALCSEMGCLFAAAYLAGRDDHSLLLTQRLGEVTLPERFWESLQEEPSAVRATLDRALAGGIVEIRDLAQVQFPGSTELWEQGVRSLTFVPIRKQDAMSGLLLLGRKTSCLAEKGNEELLSAVGVQLAVGIENARMVESQKRQVAHLSALNRGGQALARALAREALLEEIRMQVQAVLSPANISLILAAEDREGIEVGLSFRNGQRQPIQRFNRAGGLVGHILRTRKPLLTGDYEVECRRLGISSPLSWESPSRSWLGVPMLSGGRVLGALVVWDAEKAGAFGEEEKEVLATIASQAAVALENARLYQKAEQQVADLTALQMIGLEVGSTLSQGKVMELIVETVDELFQAHNVSLMLLEEGSDELRTLGYRGKDPDPLVWEQTFRLSDAQGVMAWVARTGEPAVIPEVSSDPRYLAWFPEVRSEIAVPVSAQGKVIGVLNVESEMEGAFGDHELRLLKILAGQAAIALANARLFEEAQHRIAELTALQRISTALGSAADEQHAAQVIVETVEELLGTHHVSLLTKIPGTDCFHLRAIWGKATAADLPGFGDISSSDEIGIIAWVARTGQPLLVNDVRKEPRYRGAFPGILSEVVVPILSPGAVIGVINVESERLNAFSDHTLRLLAIVANQAQASLENARLFSHSRQKIADLTALHEIGLEITSTLAVEQVLERIVDIVVGSLKPFDCAFYSLTETEPRELVIGQSFPGDSVEGLSTAPDVNRMSLEGPGVIASVAREGRAAFLPRVQEDPRYIKVFEEVVSEIAVPLLSKGRVVGVLNVETDREGAFTESTLEFLTTIAQQASVAIENARLYEMLEQNYFDTVRTLVLAMDAKDPYTRGHSVRVRRYAVELASALGMDEEDTKKVSYAGLLHDIGKIGMREDILLKPGELTPEEFEEVKLHSVLGGKLVDNVALLAGVGPLIRSEHESFAGGGYPDDLAGEAIPLGARIIAVADAYDAMTTDRAYHQAMSPGDAFKELRACAGNQFDPRVVEALVHIVTGVKKE